MESNKFFLHTIRRENGALDKGISIKDSFELAKQSYHAYLGAYAYGYKENVDFVSCFITDMTGAVLMAETWVKPVVEPTPEA